MTSRLRDVSDWRAGPRYYVACLRELFEEAGLLIVCDAWVSRATQRLRIDSTTGGQSPRGECRHARLH